LCFCSLIFKVLCQMVVFYRPLSLSKSLFSLWLSFHRFHSCFQFLDKVSSQESQVGWTTMHVDYCGLLWIIVDSLYILPLITCQGVSHPTSYFCVSHPTSYFCVSNPTSYFCVSHPTSYFCVSHPTSPILRLPSYVSHSTSPILRLPS